MKASRLLTSLVLALSAAPLWAHGVFLPQPRAVAGLDYRIVVLASNEGLRPRRFEVFRVTPQPFGPPLQERLYGAFVPPGATGRFVLTDLGEFAGLLRVTGAPQIVVRARLEISENGNSLDTVALPAATADHDDEEDRGVDLPHGRNNVDEHLQGLAHSGDGRITTDLTLVNLDSEHAAECALSLVDAKGDPLLASPFLHIPAGAALPSTNLLGDIDDPTREIVDAWGAVACENDSFTIWAAVYRNGGRDVEYILPSASMN